MRSTTIRVALAGVALLAISACSDVQSGVDKVSDCTSLVQAVSNINLNPTANPDDVQNDFDELKRKVDELRHPEVKAAAEQLRDDVERFQSAVRSANVPAANEAIGQVRQSAEDVARTCNVPVDNLLGGGN
jgi:TolA-binding protein